MSPATTATRTQHFRIHHGPTPTTITSPLFRKLITEWIQINADPSTIATIQRLGKQQTSLANYNTPGEIVDAIDTSDKETIEEMLTALLILFQAGHQIAGRILLQQFLPLIATVTRPPRQGAETHWIEDRRHIAVAEFWNLTATINVTNHTDHIIGTLAWTLRRRFTTITNDDSRHIAVEHVEDILDTDYPEDTPPKSDYYKLDDILTWAQTNEIITQAEKDLLTAIYIDGNRTTQIASTMGIKSATIRQRCHRAVQRIRDNASNIPAPAAIA